MATMRQAHAAGEKLFLNYSYAEARFSERPEWICARLEIDGELAGFHRCCLNWIKALLTMCVSNIPGPRWRGSGLACAFC